MPSFIKEVLRCLIHVFYKMHIHCNCSKCCESDCLVQTDNIDDSNGQPTTPIPSPHPSPPPTNKASISSV
jgi:hypothetical protein